MTQRHWSRMYEFRVRFTVQPLVTYVATPQRQRYDTGAAPLRHSSSLTTPQQQRYDTAAAAFRHPWPCAPQG